MAFPSDHVYPPELPVWLLNGHSLTAGERFELSQFEQGEDRNREIRTFTPYLASVSTILEADEFDTFFDWFEANLQAGSLLFDTQVAGLDGSLTQWWQARFLGPYRYEAIGFGRFVINAELILLDGPYGVEDSDGDPVRISPSVNARSVVQTDGFAVLESSDTLARGLVETDGQVIFDTTIRARGLVETEGWAIVEDETNLLLLDGAIGYLLLEGGTDRIILEP